MVDSELKMVMFERETEVNGFSIVDNCLNSSGERLHQRDWIERLIQAISAVPVRVASPLGEG